MSRHSRLAAAGLHRHTQSRGDLIGVCELPSVRSELWSSDRAVNALNCSAISAPSTIYPFRLVTPRPLISDECTLAYLPHQTLQSWCFLVPSPLHRKLRTRGPLTLHLLYFTSLIFLLLFHFETESHFVLQTDLKRIRQPVWI